MSSYVANPRGEGFVVPKPEAGESTDQGMAKLRRRIAESACHGCFDPIGYNEPFFNQATWLIHVACNQSMAADKARRDRERRSQIEGRVAV